jgi:hypothetical protein
MVRGKKSRQFPGLRFNRASNGGDVLANVDDRLVSARRYLDIIRALMADQGGADQCSESRKQLVRRFAAAAVLAEQLEARLAYGDEIDITAHALLASTLVRIAQCIGIDRPAKNSTSSLRDYLASKATEKEVTE